MFVFDHIDSHVMRLVVNERDEVFGMAERWCANLATNISVNEPQWLFSPLSTSLDPAPFLHAQGGALGEKKRAWYPLSAHALL